MWDRATDLPFHVYRDTSKISRCRITPPQCVRLRALRTREKKIFPLPGNFLGVFCRHFWKSRSSKIAVKNYLANRLMFGALSMRHQHLHVRGIQKT